MGSQYHPAPVIVSCVFGSVFFVFTALAVLVSGQQSDDQSHIQRLIDSLSSDQHVERERATAELRQLGGQAIPALYRAADASKRPELQQRAMLILGSFLDAEDEDLYKNAAEAIRRLAKSDNELAAAAASRFLAARNQDVSEWITKQMGGLVVLDVAREEQPIVEVKLDRTRGINPGFNIDPLVNEDLARVGLLRELTLLTLEYRTTFTDDALIHLKPLKKLRSLNLSRTRINGDGLRHIAPLSNLQHLNLNRCAGIEEDSLRHLAEMQGLKTLLLDGYSGSWKSDDQWISDLRMMARQQSVSWPSQSDLNQYRGGLTDRGLEHLSSLKLHHLSLQRTCVTDHGMQILETLNTLRELQLDYVAITDKGVKSLASMPELKQLSLGFTGVTDKGLEDLGQVSSLECLSLRGLPITDNGLTHLASLQKIRELDLSGTLISDAAIDILTRLPDLKRVDLQQTRVSYAGLRRLASEGKNISFPQALVSRGFAVQDQAGELVRISLAGQELGNDDVAWLKELPRLQRLDLSRNKITNDGLRYLRDLRQLTTLNLSSNAIDDQGLQYLIPLANLNWLGTEETDVTFSGIRQLIMIGQNRSAIDVVRVGGFLDQLRNREHDAQQRWHIDLTHCGLADEDTDAIAAIPGIRSLKLARNDVTDYGVSKLSTLGALQVLWIGGDDITGRSLDHLSGLENLQTLWITDANIQDSDLDKLSALPKLQVLNLCGCPISDQSVDHLINIKTLKTIIVDVMALSHLAIDRLREHNPAIEVLGSQQSVIRSMRGRGRSTLRLPQGSSRRVEMHGLATSVGEHPLTKLFGDEYFENVTHLTKQHLDHVNRWSELATVHTVSLVDADIPDGTFKHLHDLPNLKHVSLYLARFNNSELKQLAGLNQLETLNFERSTVNDDGLSDLPELRGLKSLSLGGYGTSVSKLAFLRATPHLEFLGLNRTSIKDDQLAFVGELTKLKRLDAREVRIASGVSHLAGLQNLERLDLSHTWVDNSSLQILKSLPKLKRLELDSTYVSATGLRQFAAARPDVTIASRRILSDDEYSVTAPFREQGISFSTNHNGRVTSIDLRRLEITHEILRRLLRLESLEQIKLRGPVPEETFETLNSLPELTHFWLDDGQINEHQLAQLVDGREFKELRFQRSEMSAGVFERIGTMRQLTILDLSDCPVSDRDVAHLGGLKQLSFLDLSGTQITDSTLDVIDGLTNLKWLYLKRTSITQSIPDLLKRWPKLRQISMGQN